jgi:hypothetical protein
MIFMGVFLVGMCKIKTQICSRMMRRAIVIQSPEMSASDQKQPFSTPVQKRLEADAQRIERGEYRRVLPDV